MKYIGIVLAAMIVGSAAPAFAQVFQREPPPNSLKLGQVIYVKQSSRLTCPKGQVVEVKGGGGGGTIGRQRRCVPPPR